MSNYTYRPEIIIPDYDINEVPVNIRAKKMIILDRDDEEYLRKWRDKQKKRYKYFIGFSNESKFIDPDPFERWYIFYIRPANIGTPRASPVYGTPITTPIFKPDASATLIKTLMGIPDMLL
jgi:hypothetical protein